MPMSAVLVTGPTATQNSLFLPSRTTVAETITNTHCATVGGMARLSWPGWHWLVTYRGRISWRSGNGRRWAYQRIKLLYAESPVSTGTDDCLPADIRSGQIVKSEQGERSPLSSPSLPLFPCLLYTSPSPRDRTRSRMPSSA